MGGISTFQATTATATSIFLLFSCFLEAVAPWAGKEGTGSHRMDQAFHKEICRG
jgi:hypothetical protein